MAKDICEVVLVQSPLAPQIVCLGPVLTITISQMTARAAIRTHCSFSPPIKWALRRTHGTRDKYLDELQVRKNEPAA